MPNVRPVPDGFSTIVFWPGKGVAWWHMLCAECEAFLSEYQYAVGQYKALCKKFSELPDAAALDAKLTTQITDARRDCERYKAALEAHRESHGTGGVGA